MPQRLRLRAPAWRFAWRAYLQTMRTRPPSVWFRHSSLPEAVVTTGGLGFRRGRVFFTGGGGKFAAISAGSGSGFLRIHDGTSGFAAIRLTLGNATGWSTTMVPSDVREQAASGSTMLPANAIVASLRDPVIDEENPLHAS